MAIANVKVTLKEDIKTVWKIVTSLENYAWRSDLRKIEVLEAEKKFIEYTKEGYATTFTITTFEPMKRYEFDMDNNNMCGHWTGLFSKTDNNTEINFTENITPKKWIMKPFVGIYLKKQQAAYILDLRKAIDEKQ
ncbi:SRPBCC family protein [Clostridium estertheticum]|uniref:Polyketide cyclase n=1 Tax=Clostridium estertheticum TaxID=238834 RepID=A0A7Y3WT42_9CLOT|nr:SRPBCC family protein [Clostridium estertheticum]MBW9172476.1 SRPBCC family protein [Clostridium estertheticum]NNU76633.1 polyketide cyclase [Clostridium estertheticum]WBL45373.1 SRPBCC family protein [Clostridium estertheticum]WLC73455.1 SRPBCC family protein [Clostridium estertheticum]